MNTKKYFTTLRTLSTALIAIASPMSLQGLSIGLGPFSVQLLPDAGIVPSDVYFVDRPICYAISAHKQLEILVENKETTEKNEQKVEVKKIIVDPYVFGMGKKGLPILQGNVVEEKMVKEITIKYGEDVDIEAENKEWKSKQKIGFFSGHFFSQKNKTTSINFQKVIDFRVLENSHFEVPEKLETSNEEIVRVICQVSKD